MLESLHGTATGLSKLLQEIRQKYYYPSIAKHVKKWVGQTRKGQESPNATITPELLHLPDWNFRPEDAMQIDLLLTLPPNGGHENLLTAIFVFSRNCVRFHDYCGSSTNSGNGINTCRLPLSITTRAIMRILVANHLEYCMAVFLTIVWITSMKTSQTSSLPLQLNLLRNDKTEQHCSLTKQSKI